MHKRAFTLIELLVVIAIIAILAAILFPVFAQARESAKTSVCLSNNKQVALSAVMYMSDSDDVPPMGMSVAGDSTLSFVHDRTQVYRKNADVLKCPSYPTANGGEDYTGIWGGSAAGSLLEAVRSRVGGSVKMANTFRYNAYTWNIGMFGMVTATSPVTGLRPSGQQTVPGKEVMPVNLSMMEKVADTIMFTDGYFPKRYNTTEALSGWINWWYKWEIWPRHRGGMIMTFADGHAKYFKSTALPTGGKIVDSCPSWSLGGTETYYSWTKHVSQTALNSCGIKEYPANEKQHECVPHPGTTPNWGDIHGVPGTCVGDIYVP